MRLVTVQGVDFRQFADLSVDTGLGVATPAHLVEEFPVVAFAPPYQGSQQYASASCVLRHDEVHYLGVGVAHHFPACSRGVCRGRLCKQQPEEVVYLRYRAHGGPGIGAGGFLLYGYDGAEAVYAVHVRLLQYAHEAAGVRGEGVHVPALALGIDGVEGEGTFAASAYSGDYHIFASGYLDIDPLQVMGSRPVYYDSLSRHLHLYSSLSTCSERTFTGDPV